MKTFREYLIENNTIEDIFSLNKRLNKYKYGSPFDSNLNDKNSKDLYKSLSMKDIDKFGMGTCWDFTHYYCKKYKGNSTAIFMAYFDNESGDCLKSHTIPIININGKYYWPESAWGKYMGVQEYNSKEACIKDAIKKWRQSEKQPKNSVFKVYEYDGSDPSLVHKSAHTFMKNIIYKIGKEL